MSDPSPTDDNEKDYKILLVEDEQADVVLGKNRILDIWPNATIISAGSLGEAYTACKEHQFNLVLLDLNLPDGHGPATVSEMRRLNKTVPIIVLTGLGTDIAVSQAIKLGANHVALKSQILSDDFHNILEQHVSNNA